MKGQYLAVDLGSSSLKLGLFRQDEDQAIHLLDYVICDWEMNPGWASGDYAQRFAVLHKAIAGKAYAGLPVYCSLSAQWVFMQVVCLPAVQPELLARMIGFEAQQHIPFPLNEVVWDYQLTYTDRSGAVELWIVAVKVDVAEAIGRLFGENGLNLQKIHAAPLALYHAYKYQYAAIADATLILNIGAKTSLLLCIEGERVQARSIPQGIGLSGDASQDAIRRLQAEIRRAIRFYQQRQNGARLGRILLAGGGIHSMGEAFYKSLAVPVDYFAALDKVCLAAGIDQQQLAERAGLLGELVGVGPLPQDGKRREADLLPPSLRQQRFRRRRLPYVWTALFVVLLSFAVIISQNQRKWQHLRAMVALYQADLRAQATLSGQIARELRQYQKHQQQLELFRRIARQRAFWPELLQGIYRATEKFPALWIAKLELTYTPAGSDEMHSVLDFPRQQAATGNSRSTTSPKASRIKSNLSQPLTQEPPHDLAPRGTGVYLSGFYEAGQEDRILNLYVAELAKTDLFAKVEIVNRLTVTPDDIAVKYAIHGTLQADKQVDLWP